MSSKVPFGYTAEELDRDNPYNQWMYEYPESTDESESLEEEDMEVPSVN
jgi:hypothetical protein